MKKKELEQTLRQISESGYSEPLTEAGFRSYQGDKINWFFLNNDVLWRLHLLPIGSSRCLILTLFYGAQPLYFRSPLNPLLPYDNDLGWVLYQGDYRITNPGSFDFIPLNKMYVLKAPGFGSSSLQSFYFPWFQTVTTPELAFEKRWETLLSDKTIREKLAYYLNPDLVDELLWFGAKEYYNAAIQATELSIGKQRLNESWLASPETSNHRKRQLRKYGKLLPAIDELNQQLSVLRDGGEREYKRQLQERANLFRSSLPGILE